MSSRPFRTNAGIPTIASSNRWMLGRTSWAGALGARRGVFGGRGLGQVEQVRPLRLVQLQCAGQRVQHGLGHAIQVPRSRRV
jgi:hypothetical protein